MSTILNGLFTRNSIPKFGTPVLTALKSSFTLWCFTMGRFFSREEDRHLSRPLTLANGESRPIDIVLQSFILNWAGDMNRLYEQTRNNPIEAVRKRFLAGEMPTGTVAPIIEVLSKEVEKRGIDSSFLYQNAKN